MIVLWAMAAHSGPTGTAGLGAEINVDPHAMINASFEFSDTMLSLITDTVELRWAPAGPNGRQWLAGRVEAGAAGLMVSPWTDGEPDPQRAILASYAGVEGGAVHYLPAGFYAGGMAWSRGYHFAPLDGVGTVPPVQPRVQPEAVVGYWSDTVAAYVTAGAQWAPAADVTLQPLAALTATANPGWVVGPRLELRAGVGQGLDEVSRTRLGGLNPYVVPVAGAAWAEFWVEDYAALRLGPALSLPSLNFAAVVDQARFDGGSATGFGALLDVQTGRWTERLYVGYAPWLPRPEPLGGLAMFFSIEVEFGPED